MKSLLRLGILAVVVLFSACKDKSETAQTDNLFKFKDYISHHSYGNQSIAESIRIELAQPLEQYEVTEEIDSKFLKIVPATKGKLSIENSTTLIFDPDEFLKPDTEYSVTVKLADLYSDIDKEFRNYTFAFKTITPNFKVDLGNLQSYSKEWQYVSGTITSADLITHDQVQKLITVSQGGKSLPLKWSDGIDNSKFYDFVIDSIQRKVDDTEILIEWDGKAIAAESKGSNTFAIPGQNNFKVVDVKSSHSPQASLTFNFSDPLEPNQDFAGLVTIENASDLRFETDGNVLTVYPNTRLTGTSRVTLFNGIKNVDGFRLKTEFSELISFEQLKPAVRLLSSGVILPNAASTPLYFEAVNLKSVDIRVVKIFEDNMLQFLQTSNLNNTSNYNIRRVGRRVATKTISLVEEGIPADGLWKAHAINLSEFFQADPGALYQVEFSFKKENALYDCSGSEEGNPEDDYVEYADASDLDEAEREERYWDNEIYRWRTFTYNWSERDNPCHAAYYNEDRNVTLNVMGSDLGLIAKKSKNRAYHFATSNLITSQPEPSVKIKLYNFQQQMIHTTTTDGEGLTVYDSEKNIAFAVAQKGSNYAYVKLDDGNALSLSNFDVSGKELQKGLKGFIYTERGVHRPGDSIHLTFVLNDLSNPLPKDHPVTLQLKDARGKLVERRVLNGASLSSGISEENFYYFPLATDASAPTGNWNASVNVGGVNFSKTLRVATVKPNRLKIKLDFDDEILDASKAVSGSAEAMWLHGAPARNMKIEMDATLRSTSTAFEKFKGYTFNDPVRRFDEVEVPVLSTQLSENGKVTFSEKFNISKKAPGMLNATFLTKVFEGGGDFSIDVFTKQLSPYSHFAGLRSPEPHRYGSYYTNEKTTFNVASVDAQGNAAGNRKLEVQVFKIEWRWWWSRGRDNLSRYENARVHRPVQNFTITTGNNGKGNFDLTIPEEERGRYLIRVMDKASGHATGTVTYFYRNWWRQPVDGDSESAKMLIFSSDKESYLVGDKAKITFPSGSEGKALISVESGTEVLSTQWIDTKKGETVATVELTKEMTPNVFVNISLLQPHEQTKNDLPIRLYGVIPMLVEDPATKLEPMLDMPKVLKPEETFTVEVSEENNKAMTYTIAMVDEGLLDLTRFKTPEIHKAFYTREALGVKTFDIYDYIIGAYSGSVDNIYAVGGGDDAAGAKNRKADRFKPVVKFLGPFTLKKGKTAKHDITMPNYVGSVRTMIVAGDNSKGAYGKNEVTTPVRKPLMVLASLPRKLSPGEKVTLPVTVFAMEKKVKNATITVKTGDALKPLNGTSKQVSFPEIGEQIVNFEFEVLPASEFQTIEVTASGNGEKATYNVEIDVENPNPISQRARLYTLDPNQAQSINFDTYGVAGTNSAAIEFSTLPPMDFNKRMGYLIHYPHGCIEQTTSGAFPQLYLADIFDLTYDKKQKMESNVKAAIKRLNNFQRASGGLSYWPGESEINVWGTNYAGHFMLEAKKKGYALPITFLDNWLRYQKNAARQWRSNSTSYNSSLTQAYRLFTLALAGQPELAAMNRLRESGRLSNDAKWRLAAAYALAGKTKVAEDIAKSANINFKSERYNYYTYGSVFRNQAMALETMIELGDDRRRQLSVSLAKGLSSSKWYSTQETAYALLSLSKMISKNGGKDIDVAYTMNGNAFDVKSDRAMAERDLDVRMGSNSLNITNKKGNVIYVSVSQQGKLPLGEELAEQRNLAVKTQYLDGEGKTMDVSQLRQTTEINLKIAVTNTSNDYVDNLALTQILPSGWEILNTSFTELGGGASGSARYTDIRDDRVNYYFDLKRRSTKTFTVKVNASYLGNYYLPGTQVEAMYDNTYYARNKGQWVTVEQ
ncbi:hypothetical protein J1N09_13790 [Aureitalea sp. L0-47]|uniref:alpha-2-macroglobulin family protein n=1 Tax=Aureitalea sp. L0-47 TaxID=2816962 RepID=UPI002237C52F|nr:MG2 domain-containing protein [Aureitalea sp. L0-47]MCW5520916.1 hypothetical protein [Aureitalea sp. L0-47]